jgi:CubicO group peptidase (beta-lactamase class C family)
VKVVRRSLAIFCVLLCLTLSRTFQVKAKNTEKDSPPKTVAELENAILQVLNNTHTPGVGAAIVVCEGPRWIAGIGITDVSARRPVTPDTLFRIGSVSKSFVAPAVLKLQREKKLDHNDSVRTLPPEIQFASAWESTDAMRVVHLLEHTAGFDDLHLPEYATLAIPNEESNAKTCTLPSTCCRLRICSREQTSPRIHRRVRPNSARMGDKISCLP